MFLQLKQKQKEDKKELIDYKLIQVIFKVKVKVILYYLKYI